MLSELNLTNYRCFIDKKIIFKDGVNLIYGSNAIGKTSLLESICILMRLSSPRTSKIRDIILHDKNYFIIYGKSKKNSGFNKVIDSYSLKYNRDGVKDFKKGFVKLLINSDDVRKNSVYLKSTSKIVWISSDDKLIVKGGSSLRRRFLDFTCSQVYVEYLYNLRKYNKLLKTRNSYLKNETIDRLYLSSLDKYLDQYGSEIINYRRGLIKKLLPKASEYYKKISNKTYDLDLKYVPSSTDILNDLKSNWEKDIRRSTTSYGIHKDDVTIYINGSLASKFASEGQVKSISLALKLSQAFLLKSISNFSPLILIDDISEDLDDYRKSNFLKYLPKDSQIFITSTQKDWVVEVIKPNNIIHLN